MSAAEHLQEAIDFGCTRGDEHDHIADHRAEVLDGLAKLFDDRGRALPDGGPLIAADTAALIRQHADEQPGKASPAGVEVTQPVSSSALVTSAILTQLAALQEIAACCSCGASTCPSNLASLALTGAVVAQPVPPRNSWLREQAIRDRLAAVDIRNSAAAWDLGMSILSILDGPLPRPPSSEPTQPTTQPVPVTSPDPLIVRWDRLVMHPEDPDDRDTVVCCLAPDGRPVALVLDEELRQALGASLLDPDADDDHGSMEDVFTPSELHEMSQDGEFRMDAEDDARHAEQDPGQ